MSGRVNLTEAADVWLRSSPSTGTPLEPHPEHWKPLIVDALQSSVSHTDVWGLGPLGISDRTPPDHQELAATLGFLDHDALFRVRGWVHAESLRVLVERIPFSGLTQVKFSAGREDQSWQVLSADASINLLFGPYDPETNPLQTRLAHALIQRLGWPLPP